MVKFEVISGLQFEIVTAAYFFISLLYPPNILQAQKNRSQMQIQASSHSLDRVLILGGTSFMGKSVLEHFSKTYPQMLLICVNRGKNYWNYYARKHYSFKNYISDRKDHKDTHDMIAYLNQKYKVDSQNKWKAVIDFSGFRWRDIQSVNKALEKVCERYIFISSDSVYNTLQNHSKSLCMSQSHFNICREYQKQRRDHQKNVFINDRYGYNKLKCERYLKLRCRIPTVILRLPDVIGPFDNTDRFWTTLEWIKNSHESSIPLTREDQQKKLSFVYSEDVAKTIVQIVRRQQENLQENLTLNLAFKENPSFEEFVRMIANQVGTTPNFRAVKQDSNNCYPSTEFGTISIANAIERVDFEPTPLAQAIKRTVQFFTEEAPLFSVERSQMKRMLFKKTKKKE